MKKIALYAFAALLAAASITSILTLTSPVEAQNLGGNFVSSLPSVGGVVVRRGAADPSAGAGVAAPRPALYVRTGTDQLWLKTGSGNTAWTQIVASGGAASFSSVTATGNISTTAGYIEFPADAAGPRVRCATDTDTGIGRDAANQVTLWSNGTATARTASLQFQVIGSAELTAFGRVENRAERRRSKRSVDITAVGSTVAVGGAEVVEIDLSVASVTSTATPFISDGGDGDTILLLNIHATRTLTLANDGGTATNLRLRSATRVLAAAGGYLHLRYSGTTGLWQEIGFG